MVSNKTLALLIVAAVVISLGGTLISLNKLDTLRSGEATPKLTGLVTGTGRVNLSINSSASCRVDTNVSLGSGAQPASTYSLTSDKDNTALGFQECLDASPAGCHGLQINNTGNVDLNITFSSDVGALGFLTSQTNLDASDFRYYVQNGSAALNASQGCVNITNGTTQIAGTQINILAATDHMICRNLTYTDGADTMHMEFNITLEPDIAPGSKNAILTVTCEQI